MGVHILDEPKDSMTCEKLRNPSSSSSSTPSTGRIMGVPVKSWKSRSKSQSRLGVTAKCHWSHEGPGRWRSSQGQLVAVKKVSLLQTFEAERVALQKLGLTRLQEINLGGPLEVPKLENVLVPQTKKRTMLLRKKAVTTNFFENKEKEKISSLPVFGVPLPQCLANDRLRMRTLGNDQSMGIRTCQKDHREELLSLLRIFPGNSLDTGSQSYNPSFDMRFLSPSVREELTVTRESIPDIHFGELQVPLVVQTCIRFLKSKGLNTLGIFRVSGAQKRVRQLREDLDNNKLLILDDSIKPHDVAQLLKEYFRDLPEPLLPRSLYGAFLATQGVSDPDKRVKACRWLLYLLPVVHRDTLVALLAFLKKVSQYSEDIQRKDGTRVTGNKMNSHNLATVFGPNLLRSSKGTTDSSYSIQNIEKAQERSDMILTVRLLIENYQELFQVTSEDVDSIYLQFMMDDPDMLNAILSRRYDSLMSEEIPDRSSVEIKNTTKVSTTEAFTRGSRQDTFNERDFKDIAKSSGQRDDVKSRIRPLTLAKGETEKNIEYMKSGRYQQEDRYDYHFGDRRSSGGSGKHNIRPPPFAVTAAFTIKMATKGSPNILPINVIEQDQKPSPKPRRIPYGKARHLTTPAYITEEIITNITIPPPRNSFRGMQAEISHKPTMHNKMDDFRSVEISEQHNVSKTKAMEGSGQVSVIPERWKRQEIIASEHRVQL